MGMDIQGKSGNSFRANIWSWPAILQLVKELNDEQHLGLDVSKWQYNDGDGLKTKAECILLAKAIEGRLKDNSLQKFQVQLEADPSRPEFMFIMIEKITKATGMTLEQLGGVEEPIELEMPRFFTYETSRSHLLEFTTFLRECGGSFEIL